MNTCIHFFLSSESIINTQIMAVNRLQEGPNGESSLFLTTNCQWNHNHYMGAKRYQQGAWPNGVLYQYSVSKISILTNKIV